MLALPERWDGREVVDGSGHLLRRGGGEGQARTRTLLKFELLALRVGPLPFHPLLPSAGCCQNHSF